MKKTIHLLFFTFSVLSLSVCAVVLDFHFQFVSVLSLFRNSSTLKTIFRAHSSHSLKTMCVCCCVSVFRIPYISLSDVLAAIYSDTSLRLCRFCVLFHNMEKSLNEQTNICTLSIVLCLCSLSFVNDKKPELEYYFLRTAYICMCVFCLWMSLGI